MNRFDTNNGLVRNPEDLMSCLLGLIHAFTAGGAKVCGSVSSDVSRQVCNTLVKRLILIGQLV